MVQTTTLLVAVVAVMATTALSAPAPQAAKGAKSKAPAKPVAKPNNQPAKPNSKPAAKPNNKPAAKPNNKPAAKPNSKPTAKPNSKPNNRPAVRPKPADPRANDKAYQQMIQSQNNADKGLVTDYNKQTAQAKERYGNNQARLDAQQAIELANYRDAHPLAVRSELEDYEDVEARGFWDDELDELD